jgi:hypothetical protein
MINRMQRFRRWAWNALLILSLFLCLFYAYVSLVSYSIYAGGYIDDQTNLVVLHDLGWLRASERYALLAIAFAIVPLGRLVRRASKLRREVQAQMWVKQGRCPVCGYDCRATTDRCSECGRANPLIARVVLED